ncbi:MULTISPECIES: response regulator [unclassified Streptomyces]|uniref:response regulator n=1 Tax=unclassified Streptomyces TaxID=2593676 RepID=UPI003817602B
MSDTTAGRPVRVVLADDQPLVRTALRMVIADLPDLVVAGEAANGAEAVRLTEETGADVVLMDLRMPGTDGIEATRLITGGPTGARVIVLTTFDDDEHVHGALHAGASGFLVKDMALDDILAAVRVVASGDALIAPSVTRRLIKEFTGRPRNPPVTPRRTTEGITDRERQVLTLVGRGLSNTEVAAALHISVATAKTYVTRLLAKLDARDRVHLVIIAYEAGLVSADRPDGEGEHAHGSDHTIR